MMARDRRNRDSIIYYAAVVLVGVALAWVIAQVVALQDRAEEGLQDRDVLIEDVRVLRDQVADMGQVPEAPEPEERIAEPVPPPVSDERLDAAVERFCGLPGCRGPRGFPGADSVVPGPRGRPPTQEEINSAVAGFCAGGNCRGADGRDAEDGADGADGRDGDPGRPPTDEEIAAAVAAFCAEGNCRGSDGADGADGEDGADGRGIVTVTIEGDAMQCELVIEFTDDTQDRIPVNGLLCVRLSEE